MQWLAQREQSRAELRCKLLRHAVAEAEAGAGPDASGLTPGARVEALLDWLEAHQYLSEQRFVESRVHARAARFGNVRIRHELGQHQLALSPDAARLLADSEVGRARAVRERKFGAPPASAAARARQARFLAGRGFSPDAIRRVLSAPYRSTDDSDDLDPIAG